MKNLVFLGPPGAGKGTQAQMIGEALGLKHISTGDMLRASIKNATQLGLMAKGFMDRGELVPDDVVIMMVKERLESDDCAQGYILDGFPRTLPQAERLSQITGISMVINIHVGDDALVNRLSGRRVCPACGHTTHVNVLKGSESCPSCAAALLQRDDDKPETVKTRLEVYNRQTSPLIEYYRGAGLLKQVDGDRDFVAVTQDILSAVGEL